MPPKTQNKFKTPFNKHKTKLINRSKAWGKQKFKPKPFERSTPAPLPEESKPWQHVKNDILDDEEELRSSDRFNMDSQQAKEILKQREQNHRRNIIEAKRNEQTKWESFDDIDDKAADSKKLKGNKNKDNQRPKPYRITTKNQEELSTKERNFVRQKLTRIAHRRHNNDNLALMINDLKNQNLGKPKDFKKVREGKKK